MNDVVLIGFSGTGKTTVGRVLAARLQRPFYDLDERIEAGAGRSIADLFRDEGEPGFRLRETRALEDLLGGAGRVLALGGGAPLADRNWQQLREGNCVVTLTAGQDTVTSRLAGMTDRPLLNGDLPGGVARLLPDRLPRYLGADLVVPTDDRSPEAVCDEMLARLPEGGMDRVPVSVPGAEHEVVIGRRLHGLLPAALSRAQASSVVLATDSQVGRLHATPLEAELRNSGLGTRRFEFAAGDAAKSVTQLGRFYDFLADSGVDRQGAVLALGGGAVGDAAGFGAATWMRGIPWFVMPTTLLAMVDSSIGGKTGINLRAGKNLVGAVHQPAGIFCDLAFLDSLPQVEYRAACAEIIKSALIAEPGFFDWLGTHAQALMRREPAAVRQAVVRTVRIKAAVVSTDPHEQDRRAILNYGHTAGHGLETAAAGRLRHGEAVAWGMQVAAQLSEATGLCPPSVRRRQTELLEAFELLSPLAEVDGRAVLGAMEHDKKSRAGEPRWVLLREIGQPQTGCAVEPRLIAAALEAVGVS